MVKFIKNIKNDYIITGEGQYNGMHEKSIYKLQYPDETTDQLKADIIAENILPQADYEDHHY